MPEAEVSNFHEALWEHVWEEPADKLDGVERGGSWARTARLAVGESDSAVFASHEAPMGDGDPEDIGGEGGEGGVAIGTGLRVDVPGEVPDLWVDVLEPSGLAHLLLVNSTGDGREGFNGDKEVSPGGEPSGAVLCEATARHDVMDGGVVLELSSPGGQDSGETREGGAHETLVLGEALEGERRSVEHSLVGEALRRAEKGA